MSDQECYSRSEPSLSAAWARAFLSFMDRQDRQFTPFLVSIAAGPNGNPVENEDLRDALNACLDEIGQLPVAKVAKTIFPHEIWTRRCQGDREKLYAYYLEHLPDFVEMNQEANRYGVYFARLIAFGVDPKTGDRVAHLQSPQLPADGNQLEFIISALKPGAQRMALQAAIYDPVRDQTAARRHFPCLQQLSFVPDYASGTLSLNAFYALQSFFVKAYGNWLGLLRLGAFVAGQTGLRFDRLNCFAGIQQMRSGCRPKQGELLDRLLDLSRTCVGEMAVGVRE